MELKDIWYCATGYDPANSLFLLTESTDVFKYSQKVPIFCENVSTQNGEFFSQPGDLHDKSGHKLLQLE
jgi:hypothetical protein